MAEVEQLPPPGWYTDPEVHFATRYWDGERWTDQRRHETPAPLSGLARWTVWLLALSAVGAAVWLVFDALHFANVSEALDANGASALGGSRDLTETVGLIASAPIVLACILFLVWYYRAYRNLRVLGAPGLKHRTWAVVPYWFIPLVSLLLPKHVINDVWQASDPAAPRIQDGSWRTRPLPDLLSWWWASVVIGQLAAGRATSLDLTGDGLEDERNEMIFSMISDAVWISTVVLTILVVRRITERQDRRAATIGGGARDA